VPPEVAEEVVIDLREQAYTALQAFLPARMAHHAVELRVLVGHPFERILETAVHEKVALIVLGTHGRTGLAHLIMGSVAERVVRLAPCPVLTVKTATADAQAVLSPLAP
jgi:universal stress protein A